MIAITSILAGVFIGAAMIMLYVGLKDRKSASCGDECKCKTNEENEKVCEL